MRVVADTNTVVSGLLWDGLPRKVLDTARLGFVQLYTSAPLLAELQDVLTRPKFASRLAAAGVKSSELVLGYAAFAWLVLPSAIPRVILADPDETPCWPAPLPPGPMPLFQATIISSPFRNAKA